MRPPAPASPRRPSPAARLPAADEAAYGSRQDKLAGCKKQRSAWDENARLLSKMLVRVQPPLPKEHRCRGESSVAWQRQREATLARRDQLKETPDCASARRAMEKAACSELAPGPKWVGGR